MCTSCNIHSLQFITCSVFSVQFTVTLSFTLSSGSKRKQQFNFQKIFPTPTHQHIHWLKWWLSERGGWIEHIPIPSSWSIFSLLYSTSFLRLGIVLDLPILTSVECLTVMSSAPVDEGTSGSLRPVDRRRCRGDVLLRLSEGDLLSVGGDIGGLPNTAASKTITARNVGLDNTMP